MLWKKFKKAAAVALTGCVLLGLSACGGNKVIITTSFGANEVFRVGNQRVETTELMLYLTNIANEYEQVYGDELWEMQVDENTTMLSHLKEMALAQLSQVKAMKLLAKEYDVTLSETEKTLTERAAGMYFETLSQEEREALGLEDQDIVEQIYEEKLLADKLYAYLIRDVNPEISDDEARIITVQHILLKTYSTDEHGNRQEFDETAADKVHQKAQEIYELAVAGENFDALISKYSEDTKGTYSFGMGEMEESFEEAAFALATEEIAPVVKTSHGYHIIKCISTLDREQTDLNKEKLLVSRKQEVFGNTYNAFVEQLDKQTNTELIQSLTLPDNAIVDTTELFDIYEKEVSAVLEEADS